MAARERVGNMQKVKFAMYGKAALVVAVLPTIALVAGAGRKF